MRVQIPSALLLTLHVPNSNEYMRAYMARRREDRRTKLINFLGGWCFRCGSDEDLQFDHITPGTRSFVLSGKAFDRSWTELAIELDKCQLLCRSCHLQKTIENGETGGGWNKGQSQLNLVHGTAYMYNQNKCRCIDCKYARSLNRKGEIGYSTVVSAPPGYTGKRGRQTIPP